MSARCNPHRWIGALLAAAALTVPSLAHADVPDATWGALRGREVILETLGGKRVAGKLIDVQPTSVALLLAGGDSVTVERDRVDAVRDAAGEHVPSGVSDASPGVVEWHEGDPIPIGYRRRTRYRSGFVIAGSVTFGVAWVPSAVVGGVFAVPLLAIPVVGPWIVAGSTSSGGAALYALDGAQQAVGLALLIYGVASRKTVLEPPGGAAAKTWWAPAPVSLGNGTMGWGIVGTM
jgi:hypothetical protein